MKRRFEGFIHKEIPADWNRLTQSNPLMDSKLLEILKISNPIAFRMITHTDYSCCEYETKMNILTFSKFKLCLKIQVIALPVSLCAPGYTGALPSLIADYKKRKGIFLILNIKEKPALTDVAVGETLGNCIFKNEFSTFDEYLLAMKSNYRRRINIALNKSSELHWKPVDGIDFTDEMYRLYINVFQHSKYPLECLTIDFFRLFPGEIYSLFEASKPAAFVLLREENGKISFIFGGMDYSKRDQYDLYMNMLVFIIKECIRRECLWADLGQTAENSKLRIGATVSPRYLCIFSGNSIINAILKKTVGMFSYKNDRHSHAVWKGSVANIINTSGACVLQP